MRSRRNTLRPNDARPNPAARFSCAIALVAFSLVLASCVTVKPSYKPHQFDKYSADDSASGESAPSKSESEKTTREPRGGSPDLTLESVSVHTAHFAKSDTAGARVLAAGLDMLEKRTIVVGSCWDYVNRVYTNAGYPANKRYSVYASREAGPYINPLLILPGDWIQFRNLTFGSVGHSAIFAGWIDFDRRIAITIEYAGQNRNEPGRYREYDITKCYGLIRGKD